MNELQPLMDLLGEHQALVLKVATFVGLARLLMKPISALIQKLFTAAAAHVAGTPEEDDDALLLRVLKSTPYRVGAFLVDYLASTKLPTAAAVEQKQMEKTL
jgi:hypothetical protein